MQWNKMMNMFFNKVIDENKKCVFYFYFTTKGIFWSSSVHKKLNIISLSVCVCVQLCPTLRSNGLQPSRLLYPWDIPGKNIVVVCHFLLHGIFLIQGLSSYLLSLLNRQVDSLQLSQQGSHFHPKYMKCKTLVIPLVHLLHYFFLREIISS